MTGPCAGSDAELPGCYWTSRSNDGVKSVFANFKVQSFRSGGNNDAEALAGAAKGLQVARIAKLGFVREEVGSDDVPKYQGADAPRSP